MADQHECVSGLEGTWTAARACTRCPELVAGRSRVVVGAGPAPADVLLVGAAPGSGEDALGVPWVGRAGRELDRHLEGAGLRREDVHATTLVKCLPPGRDPSPAEVADCSGYLLAQVEAVRPVVVVALGGLVTKVLRGAPDPIRARRGREEPRRLGSASFWLLPAFDPAAALYAPALSASLGADLARLPELIARGRPEVPEAPGPDAEPAPEPLVGPGQLGLF